MRVAIFSETFLPKWDGVANTVCHLLERLAEHGHETLMFAPAGGPETYAGAKIIGVPSVPFPFYTDLKLLPPWSDVGNEVFAFEPDVVHLVNPALLGLSGLKRARKMNVPVLASYHTDIPGYTVMYGDYHGAWFGDPMHKITSWPVTTGATTWVGNTPPYPDHHPDSGCMLASTTSRIMPKGRFSSRLLLIRGAGARPWRPLRQRRR